MIDGIIKNASVYPIGSGRVISGRIEGDAKGRWPDGTLIRTSYIVEELPGGVYRTRNSTCGVELRPEGWHTSGTVSGTPIEGRFSNLS